MGRESLSAINWSSVQNHVICLKAIIVIMNIKRRDILASSLFNWVKTITLLKSSIVTYTHPFFFFFFA